MTVNTKFANVSESNLANPIKKRIYYTLTSRNPSPRYIWKPKKTFNKFIETLFAEAKN